MHQVDNTERSDSVYDNTEEAENPNFIGNSGEAVATFSSLSPQWKRPLNNPSAMSWQLWVYIKTEEEEYSWSLPANMAEYANENSEKFIPDKDVKEGSCRRCRGQKILIQLKSWMIFDCSYFSKRKKCGYHDRWYIWKNLRQCNRYYGPIIQIMSYDWKC